MEKINVICITPVKNEAWILERALKCHSLWADHIFIADQGSEDGSREIAERFEKVTLVESDYSTYNMGHVRKKLLEAARKIPGKRIIIALDGDEMLSANWVNSSEWQAILAAPEGTVLYFRWANILPDHLSVWLKPCDIAFGFVDDGREYQGSRISEPRVQISETSSSLLMREMNVLHYQYNDWTRMESKQRWYQCWEHLNYSTKRPIQIYRQYHQMYGIDPSEIQPLQPEWLAEYVKQGVNMTTVPPRAFYYWDRELLDLFSKYGLDRFRKLDVWQVDWQEISQQMGYEWQQIKPLSDPRNSFEKSVHAWLKQTQPDSKRWTIRLVQNLLKIFGW